MASSTMTLSTSLGKIRGIVRDDCRVFLGVPFAHAGRFEYAVPTERLSDGPEAVFDATKPGPGCPQNRAVHEHLEHATRNFYKKEYREGDTFTYDEDCLNVNIFTPLGAEDPTRKFPVIVFFYGGGFDSGLNNENTFDGAGFARRGVITVFANYRVGVLGYFTHEEIRRRTGRDGNFGLDDQLTALRWVKAHVADFGGDPENITVMGQSAGAISTQYLCLMPENKGLFQHAVMMSGGGMFPKFALPKRAEDTHEYWLAFMKDAGRESFEDFKAAPLEKLFDAVEQIRTERKDHTYNTMPVIDGVLLPRPIDEMIRTPLPIDYMLGYSNTDLYAPIMAYIGNRFGKQNGAYIYFFDLDSPGDDNKAFHSADLRYMFETFDRSWRPYGARDLEAGCELASYVANFARTGDPNGEGLTDGPAGESSALPRWLPAAKHDANVLRIAADGTAMGYAHYFPLAVNFLKHPEPKA